MTAVSLQVGNQAFADYVDSQDFSATRINNKQHRLPVIPTMEFFKYHDTSGDVHTHDADVWATTNARGGIRRSQYGSVLKGLDGSKGVTDDCFSSSGKHIEDLRAPRSGSTMGRV